MKKTKEISFKILTIDNKCLAKNSINKIDKIIYK